MSDNNELESNFRHLFWVGAWCGLSGDGSKSANGAAAGRGGIGRINKRSNNMRVMFF